MAVNQAGITSTDGIQMTGGEVAFTAGAGTLDASQLVQVNWDTTVFDSTMEGKQRLVAALELITRRVQAAKLWPVTAAS